MNNNARYDRSTNFLELEVNVPRTIDILRDASASGIFKTLSLNNTGVCCNARWPCKTEKEVLEHKRKYIVYPYSDERYMRFLDSLL